MAFLTKVGVAKAEEGGDAAAEAAFELDILVTVKRTRRLHTTRFCTTRATHELITSISLASLRRCLRSPMHFSRHPSHGPTTACILRCPTCCDTCTMQNLQHIPVNKILPLSMLAQAHVCKRM